MLEEMMKVKTTLMVEIVNESQAQNPVRWLPYKVKSPFLGRVHNDSTLRRTPLSKEMQAMHNELAENRRNIYFKDNRQ